MRFREGLEEGDLFRIELSGLLNERHSLFRLANTIDWGSFEEAFGSSYSKTQGAPAKPIRLMVGLHYLKYTYDLSDEQVVAQWVENPYWQYFCGAQFFEYEFPLDPSSLTRWRKRISGKGIEKLLEETIKAGLKMKVITRSQLKKVSVDTTVQEKAISYPTDAKLYFRLREKLVKLAKEQALDLRQNYNRLGKKDLVMQGRYRYARQFKRARKARKRLKTQLGCVMRDIERKIKSRPELQEKFVELLAMGNRLLAQTQHSKNKLYSLHEPEVECIGKGKAHKKYEFGNKVSFVTCLKNVFILGIQGLHGNPYDGHTLNSSIEQAEKLSGVSIEEIYVDQGYRKHDYQGTGKVEMARRCLKKLKASLRKKLNLRSGIEPVIGHTKSDSRLDRNYLSGKEGDRINAILSGYAFNIRKLLKAFLLWLKLLRAFFENKRIISYTP